MDKILFEQVPDLFDSVGSLFMEKKDELCDMDAKLGDGDLGLTMSKGYSALPGLMREEAAGAGGDIGKIRTRAVALHAHRAVNIGLIAPVPGDGVAVECIDIYSCRRFVQPEISQRIFADNFGFIHNGYRAGCAFTASLCGDYGGACADCSHCAVTYR